MRSHDDGYGRMGYCKYWQDQNKMLTPEKGRTINIATQSIHKWQSGECEKCWHICRARPKALFSWIIFTIFHPWAHTCMNAGKNCKWKTTIQFHKLAFPLAFCVLDYEFKYINSELIKNYMCILWAFVLVLLWLQVGTNALFIFASSATAAFTRNHHSTAVKGRKSKSEK